MDSYRIFHADTHLRTPISSFWNQHRSNFIEFLEPTNRRLGGGAQRPNREIGFVSFVRACARSGCKVEMEVHDYSARFSFSLLWRPGVPFSLEKPV